MESHCFVGYEDVPSQVVFSDLLQELLTAIDWIFLPENTQIITLGSIRIENQRQEEKKQRGKNERERKKKEAKEKKRKDKERKEKERDERVERRRLGKEMQGEQFEPVMSDVEEMRREQIGLVPTTGERTGEGDQPQERQEKPEKPEKEQEVEQVQVRRGQPRECRRQKKTVEEREALEGQPGAGSMRKGASMGEGLQGLPDQ